MKSEVRILLVLFFDIATDSVSIFAVVVYPAFRWVDMQNS